MNNTDNPIAGHGSTGARIFISMVFVFVAATSLCVTYYMIAECCKNLLRSRRQVRAGPIHTIRATAPTTSGNDDEDAAAAAVELASMLPMFVYSSTSHQEKLNCAVCLGDFADGEKGRLLPLCGHRFHVECVDMWLNSHPSCPLCRAIVDPKAPDSPV